MSSCRSAHLQPILPDSQLQVELAEDVALVAAVLQQQARPPLLALLGVRHLHVAGGAVVLRHVAGIHVLVGLQAAEFGRVSSCALGLASCWGLVSRVAGSGSDLTTCGSELAAVLGPGKGLHASLIDMGQLLCDQKAARVQFGRAKSRPLLRVGCASGIATQQLLPPTRSHCASTLAPVSKADKFSTPYSVILPVTDLQSCHACNSTQAVIVLSRGNSLTLMQHQ